MMHALKNPSFFRPASRPTSPSPAAPPSRPDSGVGFERSRPLNRLSLNSFRRSSPAPAPNAVAPPATLVQDGSYLEMLSLKLSEAVSKALVQPSGPVTASDVVGGRRPIPAGRGHALGALITSELNAANENPHLQRAIIRSLHRPLSVLLSNLSTLILPILSSPAFLTPPAPTPQQPNPNASQLHGLGVANIAGELLETFDALSLGQDSDVRGDNLRSIREGLVSLVHRVVNSLISGIRNELFPVIDVLENPNSVSPIKSPAGAKQHTAVVTLVTHMPIYAQALKRYAATSTAQKALTPFIISLVWRAMLALSGRPYTVVSPPSSPGVIPTALPLTKKRRGSPSNSPPMTPPATRFTIKLPSSRPPTPPGVAFSTTPAGDARAIYDLMRLLPLPEEASAREATEEATNGIDALATFYEVAPSVLKASDRSVDERADDLEDLALKIPTLVALPILMKIDAQGSGSDSPSVSSILGVSEDEYRSGCLTGFGRAEECATAVGVRVCEYFQLEGKTLLLRWLEAEIEEDA
ncbi:hypothetical protein Moror_16351 [Moniliophthora roreri MCA 2997]|uniref:Uncharacterized protein n=2 Tax=Moniliophthora roreri TaxID=221103 RepID=V2XDX6_MONRO|nr:hypothetical protein Moror_16351 [Moniliophthora roreri MCA 2997]KAI3596998.1 hypothetical protein WG66_006390 [Moniliophthora roreri]